MAIKSIGDKKPIIVSNGLFKDYCLAILAAFAAQYPTGIGNRFMTEGTIAPIIRYGVGFVKC
jgi:hypothetical protein